MKLLESLRKLLTEYLQESLGTEEIKKVLLLLGKKDFHLRIYGAFFSLVADTTQSPRSIVNLLETYTCELEGFSSNKSLQAVVAFGCIEGLAERKPKLLIGPWETLLWIIVKYSSAINTKLRDVLMAVSESNEKTAKWITKFASRELCPNPCLRLELFRFIRGFKCNSFIKFKDRKSLRDKVINTLFELCYDNTSLTVNKLPNFGPTDLQAVMEDNDITARHIMNDFDLHLKKSEIIAAMFKLTKNFALLVKEKYQEHNNDVITFDPISIDSQLSACLCFCGLIPLTPDNDLIYLNHDNCLKYLVQAVDKDYFLLNNAIDTLETISQVSLSFPGGDNLQDAVTHTKDKLLHRFFKGQVNSLPKYQYLREIQGGISPAAEYQLRYFQNISVDKYNDSEYGSECYASDENDDIINDYQDNDSQMDTLDENELFNELYNELFNEEDIL